MPTKLSQSIGEMIILEARSSDWTVESFNYSEETSASLKGIAARSFNSWQFEKLLNSASDLLDRATQTRTRIRDLDGQRIAFNQSRANQDQNLTAEDFGLILRQRSFGEIPVDIIYHAPSIAANQLRIKLLIENSGTLNEGRAEADAALAQALNLFDHGEETDTKLRSRLQYHQVNSELNQAKAALLQNTLSIELSKIDLEVAQFEYENRKKSYALALAQFKERDKAALDEGPLNFGMEIELLFDVMRRDFLEASARLYAAVTGINKAFGVTHSYEPNSKSLSQATIDASKFARQLNHWLALATQHDQSFTICIPLKSQLSEEGWNNFINGQSVSFTPNSTYFEDWHHSRLRGVSASYWSASISESIGLRVFPPTTWNSNTGDIDQGDAPEVTLGRVSRFDVSQPMEVAGAVSLMNVSPNGAWWIALDKRLTTSGTALLQLEVYLHCVGIPEKSYSRMINTGE